MNNIYIWQQQIPTNLSGLFEEKCVPVYGEIVTENFAF